MPHAKKARAIGFNHIALEVGDIDEALAFYSRLFDFELRGRSKTSAFIDGDQFLALGKGRTQAADDGRHFGLVVDDKDAVRRALAEAGVDPLPGQFLDFLDPWGNRVDQLRQHPVHQGAECAARHGAAASCQEQEGDKGTSRQWHGAELKTDSRKIGRAISRIGVPGALAALTGSQYSPMNAVCSTQEQHMLLAGWDQIDISQLEQAYYLN
jgi:lactoylglutathione lyase